MKTDIIIETPRGSREKYNYDFDKKVLALKKILPMGMVFPYDFGFIPETKGGDGDPLDVIVVSELTCLPGSMVACRIIGCIIAEQTEEGKTVRNDRFIGVPVVSEVFNNIVSVDELPEQLIAGLQEFFIVYNKLEGKDFRPLKVAGPEEAMNEIKKAQY